MTCVQLLGEFLDPSLPQLPRSTAKVALIFNLKKEAPPQASPTSGINENSPTEVPASTFSDLNAISNSMVPFLPASDRVNDLYAEWDTQGTIDAVREAIEERYEVIMIEANEEAPQKILKNRPSFAFNMAEGLSGVSRESQIPALLEMFGVPYLGSDPLTLALCLDKSRAKEILTFHGIPTPRFVVIKDEEHLAGLTSGHLDRGVEIDLPAIVKPLHEGSSKGIFNSSVARTVAELEREVRIVVNTYHQPALVEELLPGREFTVGLLGNGRGVRALPIVEIKFDALPPEVNRIYSYEAKWIWDRSENPLEIFQCPAILQSDLQEKIVRVAREAYETLNCRDWARIDLRLDTRGEPCIIEINPLPGILPRPEDNSCLPKAARAAGMSYNELITTVLDIGMERCGIPVSKSRPHIAVAV